jgi:hypothetical protein
MNNQENEKAARGILKNALKKKLYLYDYIGMIVLALFDALMAGIGLIIASNDGDAMGWLYAALAFAIVAILMLAWLSALYFVDSDEAPSFTKIQVVAVVKDIFRGSSLLANGLLLTNALLENSKKVTSWNTFLTYDAIVLLVIEGLFFLYGLWQNAWVKENPERYMTPVYPIAKDEEPAPRNSEKNPAPVLKEEKPSLPKKEVVAIEAKEVQSEEKKK